MLPARPTGPIVAGPVLAVLGTVGTLQGLGLLGQNGGMNGRPGWIAIGLVAGVAGVRERRRV